MALDQKLRFVLERDLELQGISLTVEIIDQLFMYLEMLEEWNRIHNLTGVKDPKEWVSKHILDSLSIMPYLKGQRILDVGTGAGLPGIPLALAMPKCSFVLLDSNQKKITFVQHVILSLGLNNAEAVCLRVQSYKPDHLFNYVISRAYASVNDFILSAGHCLAPKGKLLAMKGKKDSILLQNLALGYTVEEILDLDIAGLDEQRCVVILRKESSS